MGGWVIEWVGGWVRLVGQGPDSPPPPPGVDKPWPGGGGGAPQVLSKAHFEARFKQISKSTHIPPPLP